VKTSRIVQKVWIRCGWPRRRGTSLPEPLLRDCCMPLRMSPCCATLPARHVLSFRWWCNPAAPVVRGSGESVF